MSLHELDLRRLEALWTMWLSVNLLLEIVLEPKLPLSVLITCVAFAESLQKFGEHRVILIDNALQSLRIQIYQLRTLLPLARLRPRCRLIWVHEFVELSVELEVCQRWHVNLVIDDTRRFLLAFFDM